MSMQESSHFAIDAQAYYPGQSYNTPAMLQLAASINVTQGRLLDVGCGNCQLLKLLAERFPDTEMAGLTVSEDERRECDKHFDVRVGDMHSLPWQDAEFDAVISRHSLEHSISPLTVLFEINRVLRLDGIFYAVVPAPVSEWIIKMKDHFSVLARPMWEKLFDDAGFAVEQYEEGTWVASFSMQHEPEMRFRLRKVRDVRLGRVSSQKAEPLPGPVPAVDALMPSTLVERRIVVVLHNLVLFDAIRSVVAGFGRDVKFLVPLIGDAGFDAMGERTYEGIAAAGFEVARTALPADVRCDIELSPYPYAACNVTQAKWRVRFMYGLAKEAWNFSLRNNVYYDFVLTYGDYDTRVLSAYSTPVRIGNPKIHPVQHDRNIDRPVLLYLPTYGPPSSIEAVSRIQIQLKRRFRVITKAHHGTTYLEPERVALLQTWVDELVHHDSSLSSLLASADVVLSDGSGAIFDAIAAGVPVAVFQDKVFGGLSGTVSLEERLVQGGLIPATDVVDEIPAMLDRALQAGIEPLAALRRDLFVALGDEATARAAAFLSELLIGSTAYDTYAVARRSLLAKLTEGGVQRYARHAAERQLDEAYRNLTDRLLADVQAELARLADRDGQIVVLNQAVADRDGQIAALNQAVAEYDGQIANLNQTVVDHDERLVALTQTMADRDGQIASLNHLLALTEAKNHELMSSTSWQITKPLRAVSGSKLIRPIVVVFRRLRRRYGESGMGYLLRAALYRALDKLRMNPYAYKFDIFLRAWKKLNPIDWNKVGVPCKAGLVSIVLPAYNGENMVAEAMDSILQQTYRKIEIIAINDGSSDGTLDILKSYAEKDQRVRVYDQKNQKLPKTLSRGFRLAQGEFLTWTSIDNRLRPNCIELMVASLTRHQHWDMIYANINIIGEDGQPLLNSDWYAGYQNPPGSEHIHLPVDVSELNIWPNNYIGAAFLYRARVAWALGDYSPCRFLTEDYDYWMRVNELMTLRHADFSDCIYDYRFHGKSLTSKDKELGITKNRVNLMVFDDFRRSYLLSKCVWILSADDSIGGKKIMSSLFRELRRRDEVIILAEEFNGLNLPRLWMPVIQIYCTEGSVESEPLNGLADTACRVFITQGVIPEKVSCRWDIYITTAIVNPGDLRRAGCDSFSGWFSVGAASDIVSLCNVRVKAKQFAAIELEASNYGQISENNFISVVVCTYRRSTSLENSLRSLLVQNIGPSDYEIIIVNNDPGDNYPRDLVRQIRSDYAQDRWPTVRLIDCPLPGLSYARNAGISSALGSIIVFMDDDAIAKENCLEKLSFSFRENPQAAIIGGHIRLNLPTPRPEICIPGREALWSQYLTSYTEFQILDHWWEFPYGALWAARRKVLCEMGGFRTDFGRIGNDFGGGEEIVASLLAQQLGYHIGVEPRAEVLHDVELHRYTRKHVEKTIKSGLVANYKMEVALYLPSSSSLPVVLKGWISDKGKHFLLKIKNMAGGDISKADVIYAIAYAKGRGLVLQEKIFDFFGRFKRPQASK